MKKVTYFLVFLLVLNSIHAQMGSRKPVVSVGVVKEEENIETRRYTGLIVSPSEVKIVARISGELLEIGFKEGEFVKKNQVLYKLDPIRYQAAVKSVEAKIAECQAQYDYARHDYERNLSLYQKKTTSKADMDKTLSNMEVYAAAKASAEALLITAKDDLKNTIIKAPMEGYIGITNYTVGNYLTPSSGVLATIIQTDPVRVRFSMSNRDFLSLFGTLENLKNNGEIRIRLADDSYYEQVGTVELMNNEANKKTDSILIYAKFKNPKKKLIIGSTVTVALTKKQNEKFPAVLPSALMHDSQGTSYVYIVDKDNKIERRNIVIGNINQDFQLVKEGLQIGERVVVDGMNKVMPGMEIEPSMYKE
ncbi:MAG: efflux RND transporter periplasmic adaptor subunit [Planctomycetes bacterium]|jgi:RND family efflux transporter MFP subunit|nr:efflux RND transporter periplasmic adaptor subunit [Planctomycetota bacterium]